MLNILNYKSNLFYLLSFIFVFILPKGSSIYFDGLPWSSTFEILLFCSILPFIIFKNFLIKQTKYIFYSLIILNILSIILIFSPKIGIDHKQFFVNQKNTNFIKTYETIWNKNSSAIQKKNWFKKSNFPIDWTARHPLNKDEKNNFKYFKNYNEFINMKLRYTSEFYIILNKNSELIFKIIGTDKFKNNFLYEDINKNIKKNLDIADTLNLEKGIYKFNFETIFVNEDWEFQVYIKDDNKLHSAFSERQIFNDINNYDIKQIKIYTTIGYFFDYLVIIFIFLLIIYAINKTKIFTKLFLLSVYFTFNLLIFYKLNLIFSFDQVGSSVLSIFLISLSIYSFKKDIFEKINIELIYFLISFFIVFFYSQRYFINIDNITWFSNGDDWEIFQVLGRLIAVDNIWVFDEERETIRRYGVRLLVAMLHVLFGKTFYAQQLFEIWAIILSSYFLSKILINMGLDKKISSIFGLIVLSIYFGENFRWLIGRGLTEFYSLFLICSLAYLFTKISNEKEHNKLDFYLCCLLGFLIVIFREDQIVIAFSLISFFFYNLKNQNIFHVTINIFKKNYNLISIYFIFVLFGFVFILAKNFISFGDISISQDAFYFKFEKFKEMLIPNYIIQNSPLLGNDANNVFKNLKNIHYLDDFYRFFTGSDPYNMPRPTSLILISGFFVSLIFLLKINKFENIYLGVFLVPIANIFTPMFLFTQAYNPRYIISYLPFALLSFVVFIYFYKSSFRK